MHHWKQPQSEHTPCPTTTRHVSKSPLMTSRVHCEVTDKRGMQHTRESHPPTTYWMFLSHTHHHLFPGCPIGRRQGAPQQRKERKDSRNVSVSSTFWSTEGAMGPGDLTQLAQPVEGGKCSRRACRTGRKWADMTSSGGGGREKIMAPTNSTLSMDATGRRATRPLLRYGQRGATLDDDPVEDLRAR